MAYPSSSDVSAGQPTASAHYNGLRADALRFGQLTADSKNVGNFFLSFTRNMNLQISPSFTTRVQAYWTADAPPMCVIDNCLLVNVAHVYSAAYSGSAAIIYVFANRTAGSTAFTLTLNASATPAAGQLLIGQAYFDGTSFTSALSYSYNALPTAHYDSGWFAVAYNNSYTKIHNLGVIPRFVRVYHSTSSVGGTENKICDVVHGATPYCSLAGLSDVNIVLTTGNNATDGTLSSTRGSSAGGYYRVLLWV